MTSLSDNFEEQSGERAYTNYKFHLATINILEDFSEEKSRLQDMQRALLNILEDLDESNEKL